MPPSATDMPADDALERAAARLGIERSYMDTSGEAREAPESTVRALVAALAARGAFGSRAGHARGDEEIVAPVRVTTLATAGMQELEVTLGAEPPQEVRWSLELHAEDGTRASLHGTCERGSDGRFTLHYPPVPGIGYHRLAIQVETGNRRWRGEQRWIVVPDRCLDYRQVLGDRPGFGLFVNLYAVRRDDDWGVGDFTALRVLCRRMGGEGADFVALSPLHATPNRWPRISPYSPSSRLYLNPVYVDPMAVPELETSERTRAWLARDTTRARLDSQRRAPLIDYDEIADLKLQAMLRLHRTFAREHRDRDTARGRAYRRFRRREGPLLDAYAVYQALDTLLHASEGHESWPSWDEAYREPTSAAVREFAESHAELVDFQRFLQFELDRQLALAAGEARDAGMRVGLIQDLALGSAADGFDAWAFQDLYVHAVDLGCPPDPLGPEGQNWALPPLDPNRLRRDGYGYWSRLLRNALRHAGCLRIDHVLGLVRQFWIPHGRRGTDGAYLQLPSFDLFGILALESRRAGALVLGEDLGTVPEGMAATLARWRVLSTRVLYFERDGDGEVPEPAELGPGAVLMATTHDLPPLAAWWSGQDLVLRHELGLIADDDALEQARAAREEERQALLRRLRAEGLLPPNQSQPPPYPWLARAVHALLARAPAPLVGVWLEDAVAEQAPVNVPGLPPERFPAWGRRLHRPLDEALADAEVIAIIRAATRPPAAGEATGDGAAVDILPPS